MSKESIVVTIIVLTLSQLSMMGINLIWALVQKIHRSKGGTV